MKEPQSRSTETEQSRSNPSAGVVQSRHSPGYGHSFIQASKANSIQMQSLEEEELQMKLTPVQMDKEMQLKQAPFQKKVDQPIVQTPTSGGSKLPSEVQAKMEGAFGSDFSDVNVHQGEHVTQIGALAYAQGTDIHFAPGQYNPNSQSGQELLGHELTHIQQQRQGRVQPTTQTKGLPVNDDKGLEAEADQMGRKVSQAKPAKTASKKIRNGATPSTQSASLQKKGNTAQFALPAIIAGMGAAEWIAAGAAGYVVAGDAVNSAAGDITYTFDEMEGVLLPGGGSDIAAYRKEHPTATITEATHHLAVWFGTEGSRKMGIKFGITFLYDGNALGNISLSIIDTYDWAGWAGNVNVNITPRSLDSGTSSVRFTINMGTNNSWILFKDRTGSAIFTLRADGDLSLVSTTRPHSQIG